METKWEVEPSIDSDFDVYVTDDDKEALEALLEVAELAWESIEPGEEKIIKIRLRF